MKTKLVGVFICFLLLFCSFSISINANYQNDEKSQVKNEYVEMSYPNPLIIRVEYDQIFNRIWIFRGYATNSFEEKIYVRFHTIPYQISFFYLSTDLEDSIFVGTYYTKKPYLIYGDNLEEFEPGEEKLINSILFFGISNRIIWGYCEGYKQYIDTWPILPFGEYEVRVTLNPYRNENYETLSIGVSNTLFFDYY
jgi:hypothetical protein